MTFQLQSLLDLRRDAEKNAQRMFEAAAAARARAEEEQDRLDARWREASAKVDQERERLAVSPPPENVAQGTARENYLARLRAEARRLAEEADEYRDGALAEAREAEERERVVFEEAHRAARAVELLRERKEAEERQLGERRADDEADDHAQAASHRRRME